MIQEHCAERESPCDRTRVRAHFCTLFSHGRAPRSNEDPTPTAESARSRNYDVQISPSAEYRIRPRD